MRGVMKKDPAVGLRHATNWVLPTSFCRILFLSYLHSAMAKYNSSTQAKMQKLDVATQKQMVLLLYAALPHQPW